MQPPRLPRLSAGVRGVVLGTALAASLPGGVAAQMPRAYMEVFAAPATMARRKAAVDNLATELHTTLQRTRKGTWGVMVVSMSTGDTLFNHNGAWTLLPASTMKLFTAALALDHFGPGGRFETQVRHTGTIRPDGVLEGNLILRGAGDPTFGGSPLERGLAAPMATLARAVADAGITRVTGSLVGDASAYDDGKVPEGWRSRYLHASYAARVSALSFNENQVTVLVGPSSKGAALTINPPVSGIDISNAVKVVAGSRGARVVVTQDSSIGRIRVSGWIGAKSPVRGYKLVVENPELFAVGALKAALATEGVKVDGLIKIGAPSDSGIRIASLTSPTLERMIAQMNGESNNHFAELLFRNVARAVGVPGSAEAANSALGRFMSEKVKVSADEVFAADGSGLSTLDRVTPRAMVHLLDYARRASWGPVLEQSLPIAGETETLRSRMRRTAATGNLRAKTGTTNDVVSLGGYVTAGNGEDLVFAIIYNGTDRFRAREAIDRMGVTLASFTR